MKKQTLYSLRSDGKIQRWECWVEGAEVWTSSGIHKGEMVSGSKPSKPKNVGKSNETTAEEQAVRDAEGLVRSKLKRGYHRTIGRAKQVDIGPMKAGSDFEKITFPCYVQPKLDGFRCMVDLTGDKPRFISKSKAAVFVLPEIEETLLDPMFKGKILDGELYVHGMPFEKISELVLNPDQQSGTLQYHIYDVPHKDQTFAERLKVLDSLETSLLGPVVRVETQWAKDHDGLIELHKRAVGLGYEGTIIRMPEGRYKFNYRSNQMIKYKDFIDEEFVVVAIAEGEGRKAGQGLPVIEIPGVGTQEITMSWPHSQQVTLLENKENYIGRRLTVKYHGKTKKGYLKQFTGLRFREKFDLEEENG